MKPPCSVKDFHVLLTESQLLQLSERTAARPQRLLTPRWDEPMSAVAQWVCMLRSEFKAADYGT